METKLAEFYKDVSEGKRMDEHLSESTALGRAISCPVTRRDAFQLAFGVKSSFTPTPQNKPHYDIEEPELTKNYTVNPEPLPQPPTVGDCAGLDDDEIRELCKRQ